ncbi:MAG: ATPase [Bacillota bacterium]|nr:ATPase [Bacillota bacterium]
MSLLTKTFKPALLSFLLFTLICGAIYPGLITGIAQTAFREKADGSIIKVTLNNDTSIEYGSVLIGQEFTKPEYLIGRPMGVTNLSPASKEQAKLVKERTAWWCSIDPKNQSDIPADLVTASGSGCDPNISPAAAEYQVPRIARERGIKESDVRAVVKECTKVRFLGFWGEPSVNVLKVNLMLDGHL